MFFSKLKMLLFWLFLIHIAFILLNHFRSIKQNEIIIFFLIIGSFFLNKDLNVSLKHLSKEILQTKKLTLKLEIHLIKTTK